MNFNIDYLPSGVDRTVLLREKIKTTLKGGTWKFENFGKHVLAEMIIILLDKLLVFLIWLKSPQMKLL